MTKIQISGAFSKEEVARGLGKEAKHKTPLSKIVPKHLIPPHPGFPVGLLPDGRAAKKAYGDFYSPESTDLDIELRLISRNERALKSKDSAKRSAAKRHLKFHYKKAISLIAPNIAAGWNRWSEYMLDLFLSEKTRKIIWGSGNCGKSAIMAVLLYTKWRVNPSKRMIVIATKVVKDAEARVFGYIKRIHAEAPGSPAHKFRLVDSAEKKAVYCRIYSKDQNQYIDDDRACIISLPIKISAKKAGNDSGTIGANLLGKHPQDLLVIAFDESQELPGQMLDEPIFLNWLTNERLDIYAWGNPKPVDYNMPETHDLLFRLGIGNIGLQALKLREKEAERCGVWGWHDTTVLHLAMTDSPKDDPDEQHYLVDQSDGTKGSRLHFLAGKETVKKILQDQAKNSPAYYAQVLGFPFLYVDSSKSHGVISPGMVKECERYPLIWKNSESSLQYFMGVDPAVSGKNDEASIVVGRAGLMSDGRQGIDLMHGKGCRRVQYVEGEKFADSTIETMWELSRQYNIPLSNIAIETHGTGEVIRYALERHLEDGKWGADYTKGLRYFIVNPSKAPTERLLFKMLGMMMPSNEIVANVTTEYWLAVRCLVLSRQIFNVPDLILRQFYSRGLFTGQGVSGKYRVEDKESMKKRGVVSPNDADALCNMVELIRNKGFKYTYYKSGGHVDYYNDAYNLKIDRIKTQKVAGLIDRVLGMGVSVESMLRAASADDEKNKNNNRFVPPISVI